MSDLEPKYGQTTISGVEDDSTIDKHLHSASHYINEARFRLHEQAMNTNDLRQTLAQHTEQKKIALLEHSQMGNQILGLRLQLDMKTDEVSDKERRLASLELEYKSKISRLEDTVRQLQQTGSLMAKKTKQAKTEAVQKGQETLAQVMLRCEKAEAMLAALGHKEDGIDARTVRRRKRTTKRKRSQDGKDSENSIGTDEDGSDFVF